MARWRLLDSRSHDPRVCAVQLVTIDENIQPRSQGHPREFVGQNRRMALGTRLENIRWGWGRLLDRWSGPVRKKETGRCVKSSSFFLFFPNDIVRLLDLLIFGSCSEFFKSLEAFVEIRTVLMSVRRCVIHKLPHLSPFDRKIND